MKLNKKISLLGISLICSSTIMTSGTVLAASSDTSQSSSVNATVTATALPNKPALPDASTNPDDDTSSDNTTENTTTGKIAIAYQPTSFSGSGNLTNGTTQETVSLKVTDNQKGHESSMGHVGVKDSTKQKNGWILKGSFTGNTSLASSSITLNNGEVKINNNGKLENLPNNEVTGETSVTLNSTPKKIMQADPTKVQYGVYDYQFKDITLNIPNPSQITTGDYTGTVNWSLEDVPGAKP